MAPGQSFYRFGALGIFNMEAPGQEGWNSRLRHAARRIIDAVMVLRAHIVILLLIRLVAGSSQIKDVFQETPQWERILAATLFALVSCWTCVHLLRKIDPPFSPKACGLAGGAISVFCLFLPGYGHGLTSALIFAAVFFVLGALDSDKRTQEPAGALGRLGMIAFIIWKLFELIGFVMICVFGVLIGIAAMLLPRHVNRKITKKPIVARWNNATTWACFLRDSQPLMRLFAEPSFWAVLVLISYPLAPVADYLAPPTLLLLTAGCWLIILTRLQVWSIRFKLPILSLGLLWIVLISAFGLNYDHRIRVLSQENNPVSSQDRSLETAFQAWIDSRTDRKDFLSSPYPVVLVAAEGGGIRAAYYVAMSLARLADWSPNLREHVFAISGVSGGALGASVFLTLCDAASSNTGLSPFYFQTASDIMLSRNFLSGPFSALMGPEILQRLIPLPWFGLDPATSLEKAFEESCRISIGRDSFAKDLRSFYNTPIPNVPLLFLNATRASNGRPVVITAFGVDDHGADYPLQDDPELRLRLSTAAVLSARFPLISPAGSMFVQKQHRLTVVDGGYFDPTGTHTLSAVIRGIAAAAQAMPKKQLPSGGMRLIVIVPHFRSSLNANKKEHRGSVDMLSVLRTLLSRGDLSWHLSSPLSSLDSTLDLVRETFPSPLKVEIDFEDDQKHPAPSEWYLSPRSRDAIRSQLPALGTYQKRETYVWPPQCFDVRASLINGLKHAREELARRRLARVSDKPFSNKRLFSSGMSTDPAATVSTPSLISALRSSGKLDASRWYGGESVGSVSSFVLKPLRADERRQLELGYGGVSSPVIEELKAAFETDTYLGKAGQPMAAPSRPVRDCVEALKWVREQTAPGTRMLLWK